MFIKTGNVLVFCVLWLVACQNTRPLLKETSSESVEISSLSPVYKNITIVKRANHEDFHPLIVQFLSAQGQIARGDLEKAEGVIEVLIKSYPKIAATFVLAADLRRAQGKEKEARAFLQRARALAPHDSAILASLALLEREE